MRFHVLLRPGSIIACSHARKKSNVRKSETIPTVLFLFERAKRKDFEDSACKDATIILEYPLMHDVGRHG